MNKNIKLLLVIFLIFPYIVYSLTTFVIQETEKISLKINATDPDADKLTIIYSAPLNNNGEWQTNYGDAGEYKATITASDGITNTSEEVLIVVNKKEEAPQIEAFVPKEDTLSIYEADSIDFSILATDLNKDKLSYEWFVDGRKAKETQDFSYDTTYNDAGTHRIIVKVSDGTTSVSKEWNVEIADINPQELLEQIKDITINENEIASLEIPNLEKYGLLYSISEPIGSDNEWQTSYDDEGTYEVKLHAEGKGFSGDKTVKVIVNDVDRAPILEKIGNKVLNEDEELQIILNANDPDGDEVAYSANNLPQDAKLEGNVFTWKPSYDTVTKYSFINRLLEKFRVLSKSFYVQFTASSKGKEAVQNVIITVKDKNRAPILEDIEPITINEGETLNINPKAYDLDGDNVKFSYSGFITIPIYKSGYEDAGTYEVKVTASDGKSETSKFARISILQSNRAPVFSGTQFIKASENDDIALLLDAYDTDGDAITYSIDNSPQGSSLKGNAFLWKPNFDVAAKQETKNFELVFVASDNKSETRQIVRAEISDKNRAPIITNATTSVVAKVNQPVLMHVKAFDEDNDSLTYTWKFGLFEKYKASTTHMRVFTTPGAKSLKVIVDDGINKVEQNINVNVI